MTTLDSVWREMQQIPEPLLDEVLDFVRYLKSKLSREKFDSAVASEPSLARDWNRPEEDEAWRAL